MEAYLVHVGILTGVYALMALGFSLAIGYTGLINLGYVGLVGFGAYTSAFLTKTWDLPFVVGVLGAMAIAALLSVLLTFPTRYLRGDYFGLVTLGFHFLAGAIFLNALPFTRGALGIPGIPRPEGFERNPEFFILVLITVVIVYVFLSRLTSSPFGQALESVRDDEDVAAALGKPVEKLKLIAMVISGAIAGLAGAYLAHAIQYISPSSFFIDPLLWCVAAVVIGGFASMRGALLGTLLLFALSEPLRFLPIPAEMVGAMRLMLFMGLLIAFVLFKPKGFLGRAQLES